MCDFFRCFKSPVFDCQSNDSKVLYSQDQPKLHSLMSCRYNDELLKLGSVFCHVLIPPPHFLDQGSYLIYLTIIFLIIIWTMSLLKFLALSLNELYEMKRYEKDGVERNFILATLHWKEHLCKENLLESNTQMYILRMVFRKQEVYCIILHLSVKPLCFGYIEKCYQMCF